MYPRRSRGGEAKLVRARRRAIHVWRWRVPGTILVQILKFNFVANFKLEGGGYRIGGQARVVTLRPEEAEYMKVPRAIFWRSSCQPIICTVFLLFGLPIGHFAEKSRNSAKPAWSVNSPCSLANAKILPRLLSEHIGSGNMPYLISSFVFVQLHSFSQHLWESE